MEADGFYFQKKMDRITLQTVVQISLSEFVLKMETYTDINIITIITGKKNPENKWATSIVKMNGRIIKNMGYLDGTMYRKHTGYYTYLKNPEISFTKNVK